MSEEPRILREMGLKEGDVVFWVAHDNGNPGDMKPHTYHRNHRIWGGCVIDESGAYITFNSECTFIFATPLTKEEMLGW